MSIFVEKNIYMIHIVDNNEHSFIIITNEKEETLYVNKKTLWLFLFL